MSDELRVIGAWPVEYTYPQNNTDPLWAYGSSCFVRDGDRFYLTIPDANLDIPPTCRTRPVLYTHDLADRRWRELLRHPLFDQREPCPLVIDRDQSIVMSVNSRLAPFRDGLNYSGEPETMWYCEPLLIDVPVDGGFGEPSKPFIAERRPFTDHSYRGIAADRAASSLLVTNNEGDLWRPGYSGRLCWAFRSPDRAFPAHGVIAFPRRGCYPMVSLRNGTAYIAITSAVEEPNQEWKRFKFEHSGVLWDFDFRKLYLAHNASVGSGSFSAPTVVDDVEETAGLIRLLDVIDDAAGGVWVLYLRRPVWFRFMRDRYFPNVDMAVELVALHAHGSEVRERRTLAACHERRDAGAELRGRVFRHGPERGGEAFATDEPAPTYGGFHRSPDGRIHVVYVLEGEYGPELLVAPLDDPRARRTVTGSRRTVTGAPPLVQFYVANDRAGSTPAHHIDIFGRRDDAVAPASVLHHYRLEVPG